MKKLLFILSMLFSFTAAKAQTWEPENLQVQSVGGFNPFVLNGITYNQFSAQVTITFTPIGNSSSVWMCPVRLTSDSSVSGILNHRSGCGAIQCLGVSNGTIIINGFSLMPGDEYYFFISSYTSSSVTNSKVYRFKSPATTGFCQEPGCMEFCTTFSTAPANPVQNIQVKGKGKNK